MRKRQGEKTFELVHVKFKKLDPKLFTLEPGLKKGGFTLPMKGPPGMAGAGNPPNGPAFGGPPAGGPPAAPGNGQ